MGRMWGLHLLIVSLVPSTWVAGWEYTGNNGPDFWEGVCASGRDQSPIDIVQAATEYDEELGAFTLAGYTQTDGQFNISNTGYTLKVSVPAGYSVSGGGLPGTYRLAQFHYHWGARDSEGSEHTLNGHQYPLEVHFVHYSAQYPGLTDAALADPQGLAVLGFFFEIGAKNDNFDDIADQMEHVTYKDQKQTVDAFSLMGLLPAENALSRYYRYQGSLTTPPCSEAVVWTVFDRPIVISQEQMDRFHALLQTAADEDDAALTNNYRPVMPAHGRTVRSSWTVGTAGAASGAAPPPALLLLGLLALARLAAAARR